MKRFLELAVLSSVIWTSHAPAAPQSSAELVLWPATASFITQITDDVLDRLGCYYETTDPQIADELMQLAVAARRSEREPEGRPDRFDHRNKLVYHSADGIRTMLEFDQAYATTPGVKGVWNRQPVWLDRSLHEQVRAIVRRTAAAQPGGQAQERCSFI